MIDWTLPVPGGSRSDRMRFVIAKAPLLTDEAYPALLSEFASQSQPSPQT